MPAVRQAVVDGLFYPAAPAALRAQVADYLAGVGADDDAARRPKLLITPHAGYEYCGAVAAHAYALLGRRRAQHQPRRAARPRASRRAATAWRPPRRMRSRRRWARSRSTSLRWPAWTTCRRWFATTGRTSASIRSRFSCPSCRRCSAASPSCRWSSATPAPRRWRRCSSAVGWRRDADRDQLGPLALPAVRAGAGRRPRHRAAHPEARCRPRAARGLRGGCDQRRAAGGAAPRPRAAPAGSAQLRRHRGRPRSRRRLRRDRVRGACTDGRVSRALVASARRRAHPVRPVSARLPAARRPARHVLRAPARRRRDGARDLRAQLGLLHRPDREEAAEPLLPRDRACCPSAPRAATWRASSARTGTSRRAARWTG